MGLGEMKYKVLFHPDAAKDLRKLNHRVKLLVFKQINKLSSRPELGKNLGAKHGIDLSGYRKIYADRKRIRIVYKILDNLVIIHILAVGKREGMEVAQKAAKRDL